MSSEQTEKLVQLSRRHLWLAIGFISLMGALAVMRLASVETKAEVASLWSTIPIVIIIAVAAMRRSKARAAANVTAQQLQAVVDDELRQASLHSAYRNAFFAMLAAQPLLAIIVTATAPAHPVGIMAVGTGLAGALTMLGSVLYYDR